MPVQVNEGQKVRHSGVYYEAGQLIHDIADEAVAELVKLGAVKDLNADAAAVSGQVKADAATLAKQADEFGASVEDQVAARAAADVEAAQATLAADGEPVGGQPTAEQLAADPALQ